MSQAGFRLLRSPHGRPCLDTPHTAPHHHHHHHRPSDQRFAVACCDAHVHARARHAHIPFCVRLAARHSTAHHGSGAACTCTLASVIEAGGGAAGGGGPHHTQQG